MIGGGMLLCAVGAMLLLAVWSLKFDDFPDSNQRGGLLALRLTAAEKKYKIKSQQDAEPKKSTAARTSRKLQKLRFDPDEMAEIEDEIDKTLPKFLREAHEEY